MDKLKNLLIAIAGLVVMVGAIIAVTPATSQGQGGMNGWALSRRKVYDE